MICRLVNQRFKLIPKRIGLHRVRLISIGRADSKLKREKAIEGRCYASPLLVPPGKPNVYRKVRSRQLAKLKLLTSATGCDIKIAPKQLAAAHNVELGRSTVLQLG